MHALKATPSVSQGKLRRVFTMSVDFRRVGGAQALQISRRIGRLGFGAATDGAGQCHR